MDSRSVAFLEVMAAIGIVGLVAFLIFLVSRQAVRARPEGGAAQYQPHWLELLLATAAVLIVAILLVWQYPPWTGTSGELTSARAFTFFVIMLIIGAAGLIIFLLTMLWRLTHQKQPDTPGREPPAGFATGSPSASDNMAATEITASHYTPVATRLMGLLGFAVGYLILNWAYVGANQQYLMMLHLVYPAGLIVALVMMFDKASRQWHVKLPGETLREWLFCNALMVLFLIGYLNLLQASTPDKYGAMFWDFLHVLGFLLVLWVVDRKTSRLRFLLAHAYMILLPLLLLLWLSAQGATAGAEVSWWQTIWPFFYLALIFFVLEIIVLMANRESGNQGAGTAKDVIFMILIIIVLIAARPEALAT